MAHHVSVFMENKPGRLERITEILSGGGVNIRAMTLATSSGGWGVLNLLVDRPQQAKDALTAGGFAAALREIVVVQMPDAPGSLGRIVGLLAKSGLNIENAYGTVLREGQGAILVIDVDRTAEAGTLLRTSGVTTLEDDAVYRL